MTPTNSFLLLGVYTSVSNLVKIDEVTKKCDRESVHRRTDTVTHTRTDEKRFYYLSHASICYSYGADKNFTALSTYRYLCRLVTAYDCYTARITAVARWIMMGLPLRTLFITNDVGRLQQQLAVIKYTGCITADVMHTARAWTPI